MTWAAVGILIAAMAGQVLPQSLNTVGRFKAGPSTAGFVLWIRCGNWHSISMLYGRVRERTGPA